jgi:hypothetical protein
LLGASRAALPDEVRSVELSGEHHGVRFMMTDDQVSEVWIEDLRTTSFDVSLAGTIISRDIQLAELLELLGPCEREDRKGGVMFHCSGLSVGTDFDGKGVFLQLRLGHM